MANFPAQRPRRLRRTPALRRLVAETRLHPADLILPVFVREGLTQPEPISSMPGVFQHTEQSLLQAADDAALLGLGGIMLFGIPSVRDAEGSAGLDPQGILNRSIAAVKEQVGDALPVMSDLCLDEFTDHGHCGSWMTAAMWTTTAPCSSTRAWQRCRPRREPTSSHPQG